MSKQYRHRSGISARSRAHISKAQNEGSFCKHPHRICMQDRLDGFIYCLDHILQDKNAPYKQCNFVSSKSGKKCTRAAPKADKKDGYCRIHTRKAAVLRYNASLKPKAKDPAQQLLDELDYYIPGSSKKIPDAPISTVGNLMEYVSGSDSDQDVTQLDQTYQGGYDSDAESVDSEPEDALKHAEVYTAEEVALITRDKLIRLQSLYINQFKRLQHLMKEKRRDFLFNLKKEIPVYGPNLGRISDAKEKRRIKRLRAVMSYRRRKGNCALLQKKSKNHRIRATPDYNGPLKEKKLPVCSFDKSASGTCDKPCVPLVKFCMEHIFYEPRQVLYKRCSKAFGVCKRPASPYQRGQVCLLHMDVPPYKAHTVKLTQLHEDKVKSLFPAALAKASESMDTKASQSSESMDTSNLEQSSLSAAALAKASQSSESMDTSNLEQSSLSALQSGLSTQAPHKLEMKTSINGKELGTSSGLNSVVSDTAANTSNIQPPSHITHLSSVKKPVADIVKYPLKEENKRLTELHQMLVTPASSESYSETSTTSKPLKGVSEKFVSSSTPLAPATSLTELQVKMTREKQAKDSTPLTILKQEEEPEVVDLTDPLIDVTGISNESNTSVTDVESVT